MTNLCEMIRLLYGFLKEVIEVVWSIERRINFTKKVCLQNIATIDLQGSYCQEERLFCGLFLENLCQCLTSCGALIQGTDLVTVRASYLLTKCRLTLRGEYQHGNRLCMAPVSTKLSVKVQIVVNLFKIRTPSNAMLNPKLQSFLFKRL